MSQSNLEMISSNLHPPHNLRHHRVMDTSLSRNLVRAESRGETFNFSSRFPSLGIINSRGYSQIRAWSMGPLSRAAPPLCPLIVYIDNLQSYTFGWTRERCQKLRNHQNYPRISADILFLDNALMDV